MTKEGVPGVWTHGFYDGWAPNYAFYAANGHNAIGRFYETQGAGDGSTRVISGRRRPGLVPAQPAAPLDALVDPQQRQPPAERRPHRHEPRRLAQGQVPGELLPQEQALRGQGPERRPRGLRLPRRRPAARPGGPPPAPAPGPGRRGPPGRQGLQGQGRRVPGRELCRPHGPALFAHGRHDARPPVLQRQRPAAVRRRRLDARPALQRQDRPGRRRRRPRRADDARQGRGRGARRDHPAGQGRRSRPISSTTTPTTSWPRSASSTRTSRSRRPRRSSRSWGKKFRAGTFILKPGDNPGNLESDAGRGREEARLRRLRRARRPRRPDARGRRAPRRGHAHLAEHPDRRLGQDRPRRVRHPLRLRFRPRRPRQRQAPRQVRRHPLRPVVGRRVQPRQRRHRRQAACPGRRPSSRRTSASRTRPTTCAAASSSTASSTCAISSGTAASSSP